MKEIIFHHKNGSEIDIRFIEDSLKWFIKNSDCRKSSNVHNIISLQLYLNHTLDAYYSIVTLSNLKKTYYFISKVITHEHNLIEQIKY